MWEIFTISLESCTEAYDMIELMKMSDVKMLEQKSKRQFFKGSYIVWSIIIVVVVLVTWFLNNGHEVRKGDGGTVEKQEALVCAAGEVEGMFFSNGAVSEVKNEIKILFSGSKMNKIFYSYTGEYQSEETAKKVNDIMHADYNTYMGRSGAYQESLLPTFAYIGSMERIDLSSGIGELNTVTARLFFLDGEEIDNIKEYSISEWKEFYEDKGFSCKY